jgi:hypothetical protein
VEVRKLYLLVQDCGDGSYAIQYTFNEDWIKKQEARYDRGEIYGPDYCGCDGDGFHYDVLNVPDECTYESLGIYWPADDGDDDGDDD